MPHTCEDCGEDFDTLSSLRLHDCPDDECDFDEYPHVSHVLATVTGKQLVGRAGPTVSKRFQSTHSTTCWNSIAIRATNTHGLTR